jgi:hypothetical protein
VMFSLGPSLSALNAASAGGLTNADLQKPSSLVVGSVNEYDEPLNPPPDLAVTSHSPIVGLHAACALKVKVSGVDAEMSRFLPWICVAVGRVIPAGGVHSSVGEMLQPAGASRLNDPILPLDGLSENVKSWVAPAFAGEGDGVMLALALGGTASAVGAARPASSSRTVRTNGVRQRGVASFTICLLTGRRTNAFAVPRPGDRRMAEAVSRR